MPEYKNWQQVLNTADVKQNGRGLRLGQRDQGASPLGARLCGFGMNERQFGARLTTDGASFRLWAPAAKRVDLLLDKPHPLQRGDDGWFSADIAGVKAGARYKFRIDDEIDVPDPASAFQPDDVSGPSEVIDHAAYRWRAADWRGRPWQETVLLETHVGTFTPEGTYRAMIDKLDHLVATGITALELMPLADFAGSRNWGYDGVLWYAPDSAYGRPDDLKALIDEAHLRGLMVFLDVVYNHFGPEGNYLGRYAPDFFTEAQTPWGSAIDYRVPEVRAFAIENALYWLRDYRFDGLRLDAVHAIAEQGEISMLHDLSRAVGKLAAETGRHIHLVLENDDNTRQPARRRAGPAARQISRAVERRLSSRLARAADRRDPRLLPRLCDDRRCSDIARALASGFVYQGEASAHRDGAAARRAERHARAHRLRQFPAEPRPDRQPRARRPARKHRRVRGDRGRAGDHAAGADDADAVHGRGMGLEGAVPVLLRFQGRSRRRRAQGPAQGIRRRLREIWRRDSRSAGRVDVPIRGAGLGLARRGERAQAADAGARTARDPPARNRSAAGRRGLRRGACRGQWPADSALAHGRRRNASARSPTCRTTRFAHAGDRTDRHRRSGAATTGDAMPPWSVLWRIWRHDNAAGHSDRDLPPAADRRFRLRRRRRHRPLSEGARHHAISMPRPS